VLAVLALSRGRRALCFEAGLHALGPANRWDLWDLCNGRAGTGNATWSKATPPYGDDEDEGRCVPGLPDVASRSVKRRGEVWR
jgi:hypothetical protein